MDEKELSKYTPPKKFLQLPIPAGMDVSSETINDSFMTADGSGNNTQFFSMLENSTSTILGDITYNTLEEIDEHEFTFTNASEAKAIDDGPVPVQADGATGENLADEDLVIFQSSNSDKLYGLHITQDEEGNLQKYQYEVIQNEDGQYESIPGTIQLVPFDTTPASVIQQIESLQDQIRLNTIQDALIDDNDNHPDDADSKVSMFIKNKDSQDTEIYITGFKEDLEVDEVLQSDASQENHGVDENLSHIDNNLAGIKLEALSNDDQHVNVVTQELLDGLCMNLGEEHRQDTEEEDPLLDKDACEEHEEAARDRSPVRGDILENAMKSIYSPIKSEKCVEMYLDDHEEEEEDIEEEEEDEDEDEITSLEEIIINEEAEDGVVHIRNIRKSDSGLRTVALYPVSKEGLDKARNRILPGRPIRQPKLLVPVNAAPLKSLNTLKRPHTITNAAVVSPQKENLGAKPSTVKKNFIKRTITKRSDANPQQLVLEESIDTVDVAVASKFDKKHGPLWNVNKMISQTKIVEAPIRQERLPRKQKIQPLERVGEELVFQHVTVTANGIIETKVDGVVKDRKKIQPSESIQLSDNEDEYARKARKRNSKKKAINIVISDSEDHDEQYADEDQCEIGEADVINENIVDDKSKNICTKCAKSFPSLGSLKTHMHVHTLENSKTQESVDAKGKASKHMCSTCSETFINTFLRNKHEKLHAAKTKNECAVCKKLFNTVMELNAHKKMHGKDTADKTNVTVNTTERRVLRSPRKTTLPTKTPGTSSGKAVQANRPKTPVVRQDAVAHRKPRLSLATSRKSIVPPRPSMTRKSMAPPRTPARKSTLPPATRKSILPTKMAPPSSVRTRASSQSSENLAKPAASRQSTSLIYRCQTCNSTFQSKHLLDTHILRSCVKSPRKLRIKSDTASPLKNKTKANISASETNLVSASTSRKSTLQNKSQSSTSLNATVSSRMNMTLGSRGKDAANKSARKKRLVLSATRRIPTNAGIPVLTAMKTPFLNLKRKLMIASDSEDEDPKP